jgi:hypothetical protein
MTWAVKYTATTASGKKDVPFKEGGMSGRDRKKSSW